MLPYLIYIDRGIVLKKRRKKNKMSFFFFVLCVVFIVMTGYQIWSTDYIQRKSAYKWPYAKDVHTFSAKYRVNPYLAIAVMKNESGFDPEAKSKTGALGLMQIMPDTGVWIAKSTDFPNFKDKLLLLPELNIKFGCWYLGELEHEFQENEILMLAAYNAGRGTVKEWMAENEWDYQFNDISQIPFPDTKKYVEKVLRDKKRYQELYKK